MINRGRCVAKTLVSGGGLSRWQCRNRGKVERDGKWYCGIHDPEAAKARREKSNAIFDERLQTKRLERQHAEALLINEGFDLGAAKGEVDTTSHFYRNCKKQRRSHSKCCDSCPFRERIEMGEKHERHE